VSEGLGWENHEVEYVPMPLGYVEWGTCVMKRYSTHLKGTEEGMDYIYGTIYYSLGDYSVSPSLLRSLLET
jgi:peptide alpha-N-acetyltransferase